MISERLHFKLEYKFRRTTSVIFGLIGILLTSGILLMMLNINVDGNIAGASPASDNSTFITQEKHIQGANAKPIALPALRIRTTNIQRMEAARTIAESISSPRIASSRDYITSLNPGGTPDYFGTIPHYANSPFPIVEPNEVVSGGIRKFVDSLPGLSPANANNIGQYIPIAVADTTTYGGADYYEIAVVEYTEKMHSDLNPTTLRGYVQLSTMIVPGAHIPLKWPNGTYITNATGIQVFAVDNPHYLGPLIIASRNRPVRVKFTNYLPTGAQGSLFIPVDTTAFGAGLGPNATNNNDNGTLCSVIPKNPTCYSENRATIHLHGGNTPWISDGTQDQWTTPAGENTSYPKGISVKYVPDMDNGTEPDGTMTFYYTNQQSARLMFYHDHAYGITRLNVYAGVAAGYLETDSVEQGMISSGILPDVGIPLVIQDKTFIENTTLAAQDPTWPFTVNASRSDLWWPHVYMPTTNETGVVNPMGRWDYGPWMVPPANAMFGPVANLVNPQFGNNPGTPNPYLVPEAFVDTPIVNGNAYPYYNFTRQAYRFRILNAANDRTFNLQLYYASTAGPFVKITGGGGSGASAVATVAANGSIIGFTITNGGLGYISPPDITIYDAPGHTPAGSGALATASINTSLGGAVDLITLSSEGSNYSVPTLCKGPSAPDQNLCTEVSMVPADPTNPAAFPADWQGMSGSSYAILDNRIEGIPNPSARGPSMIQIGTEGGFLPAPVTISNKPIGFDYNNSYQGVLNTREKALYLAGAERADIIVDFSGVPENSTLILYNDAPNPTTGADSRYDYFTYDADNTIIGGAPSTIPGYGPNTRTIMQFRVNGNTAAPAYDMNNLTTALAGAYASSQDMPIVPEEAYNAAFGTNYVNHTVGYSDMNFTFPVGTGNVTMNLTTKSINDGFDPMYGGLMTILGVEIPSARTPILYNLIDPPTEIIKNSNASTLIATLGDGTQIWRVYSNSVDTHPMHWHMFNVQVINRVNQITGVIMPPDPMELGWRETLRMNPLEDTIIALRPIKPEVPWDLPNNIRPLDVISAIGTTGQFQNIDPTGQTANVTNQLVNFGEEYVWHCHILGHEEGMIMRSMAIVVTPSMPSNLTAILDGNQNITLKWMDNSTNEINFVIERATSAGGPWITLATILSHTGPDKGALVTYNDTSAVSGTLYYYRVMANNVVGYTQTYAAPAVGYPTMSVLSDPVTTSLNIPPVAVCGPDKSGCENVGAKVQFNGTSSYDLDGTIVSYDWEFGDGATGTGVAPNHTYASYRWNGSAYQPFLINLTVTDNSGSINRTSNNVTIWMTGDANGDGTVNILDASVVGLNWNGIDPCADLNNDGMVNILDASIIGLNWGKSAIVGG